jgi:NAD(P)-dependent dehydrogenase (short-subunit alcohol dehydrogenase family)
MADVIIVTGASRGIGAATAVAAAARGYAVCVNYHRDQSAADCVVEQITGGGGRAIAVKADVASEAEVIRLFGVCCEALGAPAVLVNNAGILESGPISTISAERLRRVFELNVFGAFYCAREAVKCMSTAHGGAGGSIVNVSSVAAKLGSAGEYIDYAASKGAIDTMTVGLAKEVAEQGIRVNAVRPGIIYTDIHASGGDPGRVDRVRHAIPMKRGGDAIEIASAILWLASDDASYCTGSIIDVSGGR